MDQAVSFKEKLRTIQFSPAAKNPGSRKNYYDEQALRDGLLHSDPAEEMEKTQGVGFMRRDRRGDFYKKDKVTGDYVKAEGKDIDKVLLGGPSKEDSRRVFGSRK